MQQSNILACHLPSLLPPCQAGHPAEARTDRCAFPTLNSSRPSPSSEACPVHESQRVGDTSVLLVSALLATPNLQSSREFTTTRLRVLDDARQRKCTPPPAFCRFGCHSAAAGYSRVSQSRFFAGGFRGLYPAEIERIACQRAQSFAYRRGCHLPATSSCPLGWPRTSPWLHLLLLLRSSACAVATNGKHRDADMLPVHACNSLSPGLWESVDTSSPVGPIVAALLRRSAIHLPFAHTRRH